MPLNQAVPVGLAELARNFRRYPPQSFTGELNLAPELNGLPRRNEDPASHSRRCRRRLHDLRHSYASVGATGGLSLLFVGKLLGHKQSSTTQRYAHLAEDPGRQTGEQISEAIATALSQNCQDS
jgi:integrase